MTSREDGHTRRTPESFDRVAALYNQYRVGYPPDVVAKIIDWGHICLGSRVLEVGCGTGQLTRPLLEHGAHVDAVELGQSLAGLARLNLAAYSQLSITVARFEEWALPSSPFDAVVCATSYHWLDRKVRAQRCAQALRAGGSLVVVYPHYVSGEHLSFFEDTQQYYVKWGLSTAPYFRLPNASQVPTKYQDIDECPDFSTVERHYIPKTRTFTRDEYVGLLQTDSLILALPHAARDGLLADIAELIDTCYEGVVVRDFLYEVAVGRKAMGSSTRRFG